MYWIVPTNAVTAVMISSVRRDKPKSPILAVMPPATGSSDSNMLAGFKSRCLTSNVQHSTLTRPQQRASSTTAEGARYAIAVEVLHTLSNLESEGECRLKCETVWRTLEQLVVKRSVAELSDDVKMRIMCTASVHVKYRRMTQSREQCSLRTNTWRESTGCDLFHCNHRACVHPLDRE